MQYAGRVNIPAACIALSALPYYSVSMTKPTEPLSVLQARARNARQAAQDAINLGATRDYAATWIARARAAEARYEAAKQAHMAAIRRANAKRNTGIAGVHTRAEGDAR